MSDVRGTNDDVRVERDRIGVHNEAETIRRDRIRWGPVWAGVVTAVGTYIFLQLALVATGIVDLTEGVAGDAIASAIAALIAFFVGGVTVGATAMWQGADDGVLHGIIMWFAALVALILISAFGGGVALGSIDAGDAFEDLRNPDIDAEQASEDAEEAAAKALLGLTFGLAAAAAGGAVGAKMWPKDDAFVDVARVRRG
jgi:hypothetical protein